MMLSEDTMSGAVAAALSSLAKANSVPLATEGIKPLSLPGPDSVQKTLLEQELTSLAKRIHELEIRASSNGTQNMPVTPSEPGSAPILSSHSGLTSQSKSSHSRKSSRDSQATWVNTLLTARPKSSAGEPQGSVATQLTDAQLDQIRDHVNRQSEEIQSQRAFIDDVGSQLAEQRESTERAVAGLFRGLEEIKALKRELAKHQQANTAFQKALREIGNIVTCVADGDLSKKVLIHSKELDPEITTFKKTINRMVDQLQEFALQVTHLAREVGTEGRLGGQAAVPGVSGIWLDLQDNVNVMANNLTSQVREIAVVTTAVAHGDLSRKIERRAKGEILELQQTINVMVDQLRVFATEVTRVSRDVGTEGVLGGQAQIPGVRGAWRELTENVNAMANNLTTQVRDIAKVTKGVAQGDLTQHVSAECKGEILELKSTINSMVDQLSQFAQEVTILAQEVGTEGRLGGQAKVHGVSGTWESLTLNVNAMANNLTTQVREIAEVTTAVAKGDLSKKITADVKGEILELKITINTMVDRLRTFGFEVSKVAREVGTDGTLGGQARVEDVDGLWRQITENVNTMANNLTGQVRNISDVTQAIARGDMSRRIHVSAQGEILHLKNTINNMVDRLDDWSQAVSRVARDVGVDGKMGGQAHVIGLEGRWKLITTDVNIMAQNLTQQVRAFADITNAANSGDFTQEITIAASGEMDELKRKINKMVSGLRESIEKNTKARETAEAANKTKSEFLANMSHEIRTPMNGIIGMTQLTLDSELTSYQRDMLNTVHQLANSLLTIIDDILDISKIEANRMDIERIPFSVRGTIFNSLKTLIVRANERGLALNYMVDNRTPDYVVGDSFRLRQIIVNLVGNAIKFTEQGHVTVSIQETEQYDCGPGEYRIKFSVVDTGIGIRREKKDVIFETFQQADGSMTRRFGGTGLGLSISKRLVTLMGGTMWVESEYGRGSCFAFTCKVRLANPAIEAIKPSLQPYQNHTILFLDEGNTGSAKEIELALKQLDLVPMVVRPSEHKQLPELPSANGHPYDCILVDNFETAKMLRKFDRYKYIPIVLLAKSISTSFKTALEDGVSGYMTTPCKPIDLANALIPALEGKATPSKSDHSRSFDILLAEDNHVNQKLAVKILQKYQHNVTVANNGLEAFEAIQKRAFDVVLMDVQMPVMGGFEATSRIREWEKKNKLDRTPILALTAHAMLGDREKCLQAEMDDYLSKPLKQTQLIQCILKYATMSGAMLENKNNARRSLMMDQSRSGLREATPSSGSSPLLKRPGLDHRGMSEMPSGMESPAIVTAEQGDPLERLLLRSHSG